MTDCHLVAAGVGNHRQAELIGATVDPFSAIANQRIGRSTSGLVTGPTNPMAMAGSLVLFDDCTDGHYIFRLVLRESLG